MDSVTSILPYVGVEEVAGTANIIKTLKQITAELIGTMFLVLFGCGSCLGIAETDYVRIALAFGLIVATMAQSIGHISGCHINPSVTAGLFIGRKIGLIRSILYIVAQCLGGVIGAGLLSVLMPNSVEKGLGQSTLSTTNGTSAGQGFGIEFLIVFVLVLVVFGAAADENNEVKGSAPLAIGLSITAGHLLAVPFTGASMNPARTFGPAVILGDFSNHWVYWLGPILGGICAAIVYQMLFTADSKAEKDPKNEDYNAVDTKDVNDP